MNMSVHPDRAQWIARISTAWQQSVDGLGTGRLLAAKTDPKMQHGEGGPWRKGMPFNRHTAHKLTQIAGDKRLTNVSHRKHLRPSFITLYELTKLNDGSRSEAARCHHPPRRAA
jgi:hypothetical protein